MADAKTYTAALLIVGNEILSGRTTDANLPYIAGRLNTLGIRLSEVRVVPDIESEIVDAVNMLRRGQGLWRALDRTPGSAPPAAGTL
jgi:molybdopterin-biosynthesis enzyme MoeA-like protein